MNHELFEFPKYITM